MYKSNIGYHKRCFSSISTLLISMLFVFSISLTIDINSKIVLTQASKPLEDYQFVREWGNYGWADGYFSDWLTGIAIDSADNVYILDNGNNRTQKFNGNGTFITTWNFNNTYMVTPMVADGMVIDSSNNIHIADYSSYQVQKYDNNGSLVLTWGSQGETIGPWSPRGIAIDSKDNVYVVNHYDNRIQKFDNNGNFITKWGSFGTDNGQFQNPTGIATDSKDNVYVADTYNNRIQKFDSDGNFLLKWGSQGSGDGQFEIPEEYYIDIVHHIATDSKDNVYVADTYNNRIQKFDSDGNFLSKSGSEGVFAGQFMVPLDIAINSHDEIYVLDAYNNRVQVFVQNPSFSDGGNNLELLEGITDQI